MYILLEYVVVFVLINLFYYFIISMNGKKTDDNVSKKKRKKIKRDIPVELLYIKRIYNVDIDKVDHNKFNYVYSFINAFIITTIYIILVYLLEGWILRIVVGIVLLILMFIICYGLLGRYYSKKGSR